MAHHNRYIVCDNVTTYDHLERSDSSCSVEAEESLADVVDLTVTDAEVGEVEADTQGLPSRRTGELHHGSMDAHFANSKLAHAVHYCGVLYLPDLKHLADGFEFDES